MKELIVTIHRRRPLKLAKYLYVVAAVDESGWFDVAVDAAIG